MKLELAQELREKYPHVFQVEGRTPMAFFGIEVGDGWYKILDAGFSLIDIHLKYNIDRASMNKKNVNPTEGFRLLQVKEKFGTLRMYTAGFDDYIDGVIDMMETMSESTCEQCGNPGKSHDNGWISTLCDRCNEKHASGN